MKTILKAEHLHRAVLDLALLYNREFGVTFPPLNAPLMLFGYVKRLALPCKITQNITKGGLFNSNRVPQWRSILP